MASWKYTKRRLNGKLTRVKVKTIGDRTLVRKVGIRNSSDANARTSHKKRRKKSSGYGGMF